MKIQIEVPQIKCSRCNSLGSHDPTVLQQTASEGSAVDNRGVPWKVVASKLPAGWESVGPEAKAICPQCVDAWKRTADAFFQGMGPKQMVEHVDTWPDAETKARATAARGPTIPATLPVVKSSNMQRAEVQRGSNIPQMAPPPSYSPNHIHTSRQAVLRQSGGAAPLPTHSPAPAAAQLSQQTAPLPQPTIINAKAGSVLRPGKITTQMPMQQHRQSMVSTIPVQAQREVTPVTSTPPLQTEVKTDPTPRAPEHNDVRVDRLIGANEITEMKESPVPQTSERADTRVRVDRVISAKDVTSTKPDDTSSESWESAPPAWGSAAADVVTDAD